MGFTFVQRFHIHAFFVFVISTKTTLKFLSMLSLTFRLGAATVVGSLLSLSGFAQTPAAQPNAARPTQYAKTITADDLRKHLTILAADDMEGRETGTRGQKKAAEYIAKQFAADGLKPIAPAADGKTSYMQPFTLYKKMWGEFYVKTDGKQFAYLKDFLTNGLLNLPQETNFETVFVNYGIVDDKFNDYVNLDVKGKAVVMLDGEPKNADGSSAVTGAKDPSKWGKPDSWRIRTSTAKDKGAAQVFIVSAATAEEFKKLLTERGALQQRFNRLGVKPGSENVGTVGTFMISTDMAAALLGKKPEQMTNAIEQIRTKGTSTVGKLAGNVAVKAERKDENVQTENVMGYDHIGISPDGQVNNGANDDGSGTVSVLELAQAFAKAKAEGNGPRRSMLFLTVVGEEKGLLGSEYYADISPVLALSNTVADLNIDMVGRVDDLHQNKSPKDNYIYAIGSDKLSSDLHRISENANSQYTQMELDYKYNEPSDPERIYYRSDHYNFAKHKIPIIFYFNGLHADYHRPTDDIEKIDFNLAEKTARLVFYTAWEIANREERLKVDSNKP
jgi:hypothetical protein